MRTRTGWTGLLATLVAWPALGIDFGIHNRYGEPVDRGAFTAQVWTTDSSRFDCGYGLRVSRDGHRMLLIVRRVAAPGPDAGCMNLDGTIGELPVGNYDIEVRSLTADESSYDAKLRTLTVAPIAGRCNAYPSLQPALYVVDKSDSAAALKARIANDPAFAARIGNPTVAGDLPLSGAGVWLAYPPLVDATYMQYTLDQTGEFASVGRNGWVCFATPPPDSVASFVEFHHAGLDHYFYTGNAGEIAAIDAGKVGPWLRTGHSFRAVTQPGCISNTTDTIVYRFYGRPGSGPDSHFFTRDRAECGIVERSGQWDFEGTPMWASPLAADGSCTGLSPGSRVPLYRLWRPFGDSNHRFTTEPAIVAEMKAQGWVDEGAAMCVLAPDPA
ncbi:MAG: hypothetical protein IT522_03885 [Burkholderiales bacterium]|nr:hypothetical protein [Burkholderiales bacterium]